MKSTSAKSLPVIVSEWAASDSHARRAAIVSTSGEAWTYADLDRGGARFAALLVELGVQAGDRVGLYLERSPATVAAMLGALRVGAVYVPLDPYSPPARTALVANDCGMRVLVLSSERWTSWREASTKGLTRGNAPGVFVVAGDRGQVVEQATEGPPVRIWSDPLGGPDGPSAERPTGASPDALAYILYTSGSTGVPKGVMLSHENALAFAEWAGALVGLTSDDRVASIAPFHFDLSVFDIYSTFMAGGTVVLCEDPARAPPSAIAERMAEARVSVVYAVPSVLAMLLDHGELESRGRRLRAIVFAGEVFPVPQLRRLMLALPGARYFNFFGPTETNVCTYYEVTAPPSQDDPPIPIGRAASAATLSVVDDRGVELRVEDGPDAVGQLWVDGPTIMMGYWSSSGAPRAPRPYPTGDRVAWRADGELLYRGRRDHMVKVHGVRIELGEVEAALHRNEAIAEAAAVASSGLLVAFVAVKPTAAEAASVLSLKRALSALLPRSMVPERFVFLENLPRTSNGKTDRVRLASMAAELDGGT